MVDSTKNIQNNVTFKLGEGIYNVALQTPLEVSYFIEQAGDKFQIIEGEFNGEKRDGEDAVQFASRVAPTDFMSQLKTVPARMQEILSTIAWYQDMYDREQMRKAEQLYSQDRIFATDFDF